MLKNTFQANETEKQADVAILISEKKISQRLKEDIL